jgi:hypothetical protein
MQSDNREVAELSPSEIAALPTAGQLPDALPVPSSPPPASGLPSLKEDADVATPYQLLQAKLLGTAAAARAVPKLLSLLRTLALFPGARCLQHTGSLLKWDCSKVHSCPKCNLPGAGGESDVEVH